MSKAVSEKNEQRRRILRAATAAPIVLTLPSGAALANTSLMCDQNSKARFDWEKNSINTFSPAADDWMRVKLQEYQIVVVSGDAPVIGFQYNGQWYKVESDVAMLIGTPDEATLTGNSIYGLADYNGGNPVVLLDKNSAVSPIAGASCWNSLTGSNHASNVLLP